MLRRVVGGRSGENPFGSDGKIVDNNRTALHEWKRGVRDKEHSRQVGCDDFVPLLDRELVYQHVGMGDASIVHQNGNVTELAADCLEHLLNALRIPDIACNCEYANFLAGKLGLDLAQARLVAPTDSEMTSLDSKGPRDCETNSLRGAGYERDFSLQRVFYFDRVAPDALVRGLPVRFSK